MPALHRGSGRRHALRDRRLRGPWQHDEVIHQAVKKTEKIEEKEGARREEEEKSWPQRIKIKISYPEADFFKQSKAQT